MHDRPNLEVTLRALEMALAARVIKPGRIEEVLTPAEQARICPPEDNWKYIIRDNWMEKKGEAEVRTLAFVIGSAKTHGLTDAGEIYGLFRPGLAEFLPREELGKLLTRGAKEVLTDQVLYDTLDRKVVVESLQRSDVLALIDKIAIGNGIVKLSASETAVEVAEGVEIPGDDLQPVDQGWDRSKQGTFPDDGDPEITRLPSRQRGKGSRRASRDPHERNLTVCATHRAIGLFFSFFLLRREAR